MKPVQKAPKSAGLARLLRQVLTSACLLFSVTGMSHAATLTIDEAVTEALAANPRMAGSAAYRRAAEQEKSAAAADFFPKLSASYRYRNLSESPYVNIMGNETVTNSTQQHHWEVALTQPLFTGFAVSSRNRLAELGLETRRLEEEMTRIQLVRDVKQACYHLLMMEKQEAVAEAVRENLHAHRMDAERFHAEGIIPLNDLLKARVAEAEAEQQKIKAGARTYDARAALNILTGRPWSDEISVRDIQGAERMDIDMERFMARAMEQRPDIAEISRAADAKDQEKRLAESDYYPHVELFGKYEQDGDDPGARNNDYSNPYNASVGVQAQWNLFEAGKTKSLSAKARFEKNALAHAQRQLQDEVRLQVQSACRALEVADKNIVTAEKALGQAREHWRITDLRYRQQLTTSTEVLDACAFLSQAETGYYEALYGYGIARADLMFATGDQ